MGAVQAANESLECRNCHSEASMDITQQSPRASVAHQRFLFTGEKICIDCHKGIAHHRPDMRGVPGWQQRDFSARPVWCFHLTSARWLGREGSNLRMAESKSAALPLGYAPTG
jgi:hypothetical protein